MRDTKSPTPAAQSRPDDKPTRHRLLLRAATITLVGVPGAAAIPYRLLLRAATITLVGVPGAAAIPFWTAASTADCSPLSEPSGTLAVVTSPVEPVQPVMTVVPVPVDGQPVQPVVTVVPVPVDGQPVEPVVTRVPVPVPAEPVEPVVTVAPVPVPSETVPPGGTIVPGTLGLSNARFGLRASGRSAALDPQAPLGACAPGMLPSDAGLDGESLGVEAQATGGRAPRPGSAQTATQELPQTGTATVSLALAAGVLILAGGGLIRAAGRFRRPAS